MCVHEEPAGGEDVEDEQARGEAEPSEGAQPRQRRSHEGAQRDDGEQVEELRPLGSRHEALRQDTVDDRGVNLDAGIQRAEGRVPQIVGAQGGGADEHDSILERAARYLAPENVGNGNLGKRLRGTEVVDEQLPALVGRDEPLAHLDPIHPMAADLHRETWPSQIVPGAQDRERREEVLPRLDDEWHPSENAIRITAQTEVPGRGGDVTEDVEVALRSVGPDEWQRARVRRLVGDQRVL